MKENHITAFNHGALCEMLRRARNDELAQVLEDVKKEQERRKAIQKEMLVVGLKNAVNAILDAGYSITISTIDDIENPDCVIHSNNSICTSIVISEEDK